MGEGRAMVGDTEVTLPYRNSAGVFISKLSTRFLRLSTDVDSIQVTWDVDQRIYIRVSPRYRNQVNLVRFHSPLGSRW